MEIKLHIIDNKKSIINGGIWVGKNEYKKTTHMNC